MEDNQQPCPYIDHFKEFEKQKYGVDVIIGTHPIPQSYYNAHTALRTWGSKEWKEKIKYVLTDELMRQKYS